MAAYTFNFKQNNKDAYGWRRLTRIAIDKLEKFGLNFFKCASSDEAPLRVSCS